MDTTIGASFMTKTIKVDEQTFKFQIWDTAGQEKYRALAPMYYRGAAAAIVVFDITRESSYQTLRMWINELKKHGPQNMVLAIAGNKNDLEDMREVQSKTAQEYADTQNAIFIETSAKSAINVSALFVEISKRLALKDDSLMVGARNSHTVNLNKQQSLSTKSKSSCCSGSK
jgi:Ras-related protein Rab-22